MIDAKDWCEEIYQDVLQNKKRLVFTAGASCSGKGTNTKALVTYLNERGIRALHIEADMYYKGVARIITEKALMREEFKKYAGSCKEIYEALLAVNKKDDLKDKFKPENIEPMARNLMQIIEKDDVKPLLHALYEEISNINFDEPSTNNFEALISDLKGLVNGETRMLSSYSFDFSECYEDPKQLRSGNDYDVFCVEGLYMLRPEILKAFNPNDIATAFIECDSSTLLARRFHRDILLGRTSMLPEVTISSTLKNVMPAYYTYIFPTKDYAKHIHYASLTPKEVGLRRFNAQVKYPLSFEQYNSIKLNNYWNVSNGLQKDIFFSDTNGNNQIMVRLRAIDGFVNSLTFKMGSETTDRHIDNYNLREIFKNEELSLNEFCQAMANCGFVYDSSLTKYRETYGILGWDGVFTINLDEFKNEERFIEIENASQLDQRKFEQQYLLADKITTSYLDYFTKRYKNLEDAQGEVQDN